MFSSYFLHIPSYFLHISSEFGPGRREREGGRFQGGALQISYLAQVWSSEFLQVPRWPMIGRNFPYLSSRLAPCFDRFRVIFSFIFLLISISSALRPERRRGTDFKGGREDSQISYTRKLGVGLRTEGKFYNCQRQDFRWGKRQHFCWRHWLLLVKVGHSTIVPGAGRSRWTGEKRIGPLSWQKES